MFLILCSIDLIELLYYYIIYLEGIELVKKIVFSKSHYLIDLMLNPCFLRTETESSTPSGESGWIERVLIISSISNNADLICSCKPVGSDEKGIEDSGLG